MRLLRFSFLTRQDIADGYIWYQSTRTGLGDLFLIQVEASLAQLARHPLSAPVYYGEVRRMVLRRFPYSIYYRVTERVIDIMGIRPFASDPASMLKRIPD